ncbi:MAG TPA: hypothetical protein VFQ25_07555 [Ktedonobacterales bacterium]|nr:hypothetical protein [Ktedonobacterales bacterium]
MTQRKTASASEHDERVESARSAFPPNWLLAPDYDPNDHLMSLKGKDYLNVQHRLLWFMRDQRDMIASGLAAVPYTIHTELVDLDRETGWAHFRTTVRDVLGNESTMYGSESARDFPDYIEKASTKSLGRALLALGYGAAFAPEMDEGERIVDSPVERRPNSQMERAPAKRPAGMVRETPVAQPVAQPAPQSADSEPPATEQQLVSIRKLYEALHRPQGETPTTYAQARQLITQLSAEYQRMRRAS